MAITSVWAERYKKHAAAFAAKHAGEPGVLFDVILDSKDGCWHIHRAGCSDVSRTLTKGHVNSAEPYIGIDAKQVGDEQILDSEMREMGYGEESVVIHNCCKGHKYVAPVVAEEPKVEENRHQEAADTRKAAAEEYGVREDKKMYGTTDWYCVKGVRGGVRIRRERDIKPGETKLTGPYFTKDQAKCEKGEAEYYLAHPEELKAKGNI